MADVVGSAFSWLSVTPVGKQVFLLVVAANPKRHALHDDNSRTVQKAAGGRKKRPPVAVKKQQFVYFTYMTSAVRK